MNITRTKKDYEIKGILKREKNGGCAACLKYSVSIFVEQIFKMQRLEVSCAVRRLYTSFGAKGLNLLSCALIIVLPRLFFKYTDIS